MALFSVHVFTAGDDSQAYQGNPRRFRVSDNPDPTNWIKVHEFKAFRSPVPGTVPIYVSEAGGGATRPGGDPHRCRVAYDSGVPMNWTRDVLIFHAYASPQPNTVPHYVFERGGGDPAAGDPNRCEITTNPTPAPGWALKLTFYAEDANLITLHNYFAGNDAEAPGNPRRGTVSQDTSPGNQGWTKTMEFKAYKNPVPGTVQYFVSEAGGTPNYPDPYRFRIHTNSGIPMGWTRDQFTFYAYPYQVAGTVPFFVMERGGGAPAAGDPNRCEITRNPQPLPGWHIMSTFYAFA